MNTPRPSRPPAAYDPPPSGGAGDTQRREALWARVQRASSQSNAALERIAKHTPLATRAITDEAIALCARIERDAARLTPIPPPRALDAALGPGVLFVDDDDFARESVAYTFRRLAPDIPLHLAANADEAFAVWERERPAMVVADLWLKGSVDGDSVLARMPRGVRRVLVSGTIHSKHLLLCARRALATPLAKDEDLFATLLSMAREQYVKPRP